MAPWVPERRDVMWINDSHHETGRRPFLVLSPASFNERTGTVIGLPMTSAEANASNPFAVKVLRPAGVTEPSEASYILAHQPMSIDWRVRGGEEHPWRQVEGTTFEAVCEKLNAIISVA